MARSLIASDNFNRASLGADWAQLRPNDGSIIIDSSIRLGASSVGAGRWVGAGAFTDDQYASLKLVSIGFGGSARIGVLVRASGDIDAARDYYFYLLNDGTNVAHLGKVVNGTETSLASGASAFVTNDLIEVEIEGTALRGLRNGVVERSVTVSDLATGKPGVMNEETDQVFGDDWIAGNLVAAPSGPPFIGGRTIYKLSPQRWG